MPTTQTETPAQSPGLLLPRYASCLKHGRGGLTHDAREGCAACQKERQSVTRYGISNAIDAPYSSSLYERAAAKVVVVACFALLVVIGAMLFIVRQANAHLDRAITRIERASR